MSGTETTLPAPCICGRTVKRKGYCAGCLRALSDYGTKPLDASVLREPKLSAVKRAKPRRPDFCATCPRCGELASPRAVACASCGTALYIGKARLR